MTQFDPMALLQYLAEYDFQSNPYFIFAAAAFFILILIYLFRKRRQPSPVAKESLIDTFQVPDNNAHTVLARPLPRVAPAPTKAMIPPAPAAAIAESAYREPVYPNAPQDSILRRHYISHVRFMIEAVSFPCPSDSVLRRHYQQLLASELETCLNDQAALQRLINRYEEHEKAERPALIARHIPHMEKDADTKALETAPTVPQDSILRRHYLAHIRYMLETVTSPAPSDSILRRHHDQLLASELENCQADGAHLNGLIRRFEAQKTGL